MTSLSLLAGSTVAGKLFSEHRAKQQKHLSELVAVKHLSEPVVGKYFREPVAGLHIIEPVAGIHFNEAIAGNILENL